MSESYSLEVWFDENDFFANDTGWKVLVNGDLYEGNNRRETIMNALGLL